MARRPFTLLSAASALLCLATAGLWVRSRFADDVYLHGSVRGDGTAAALSAVQFNLGMAYFERTDYSFAEPTTVRIHNPAWQPPIVPARWRLVWPAWPSHREADRRLIGFGVDDYTRTTRYAIGPYRLIADRVERLRQWRFPLRVPLGGFGLAPALWVWRSWRGRVRRRSPVGLCPACGYDLRATPGRCPECGAEPKGATALSGC